MGAYKPQKASFFAQGLGAPGKQLNSLVITLNSQCVPGHSEQLPVPKHDFRWLVQLPGGIGGGGGGAPLLHDDVA